MVSCTLEVGFSKLFLYNDDEGPNGRQQIKRPDVRNIYEDICTLVSPGIVSFIGSVTDHHLFHMTRA